MAQQTSVQGSRRPPGLSCGSSGWAATAVLGILAALATSCSSPSPTPPPADRGLAAQYKVEVAGSIRLDDIRVPGRAWLDYLVFPDGRVTVTALRANIPDLDIVTRFLFFETDRERLRCTEFSNTAAVEGRLMSGGLLVFPASAASLAGLSYTDRDAGGACTGAVRLITATNDRAFSLEHDPAHDRFRFRGSFVTSYRDKTFDLRIDMDGSYVNRPPDARIGVGGPGLDPDLIQGGCPPLTGINPPTAEANDPEGLRLNLLSVSTDPDGGWGRSDIEREQWAHSTGGPYEFLGEGRLIGPVLFELGLQHRLELTVSDRLGARGRDVCGFLVSDTTPPAVDPPVPITVPCTVTGGATPDTSTGLAEFLQSATASDLVDPDPSPLPPQVDGADVDGSTLFPVGRSTTVVFRARDRHGLVGSDLSTVTVRYRLEITLPVAAVDPTLQPIRIEPSVRIDETCGPLRLVLESIRSNAPQLDPNDILEAELGTDDRDFVIRAVPAPSGADRVFEITYLAVDEAGREERHTEQLVVRGEGGKQ